MRNVLSISLLLLLLAGCDDHRLGEVLTTADSLLVEDADSALRYLEAHEGLKPDGSKGQRMRFELLRAMAQNRAYVDFTSDSVMKEVVERISGDSSSQAKRPRSSASDHVPVL